MMDLKKYGANPPSEIRVSEYTGSTGEFGRDEIYWWVFRREHDLPAFSRETTSALAAAQTLKNEAVKLRDLSLESLDELMDAYVRFTVQFHKEIAIVKEYVEKLKEKDELAPSIMFNYRIWGSTRMTLRDFRTTDLLKDDPETVQTCALMVLGLAVRGIPVVDWIKQDIARKTTEKVIQKRAARDAAANFLEYIEGVRDSLRNIQMDIGKRESLDRLYTSDDFWRSFILKAVNSKKTEQKFWDFKQTLDMWGRKPANEKNEKANKFAEIVAGFANNKGGVIVVGVTDSSPRQIVGLEGGPLDIENYMKYTSQTIRKYISYDKDFVHLQQINVPDQNGDNKLCLAVVIEQTAQVLGVSGVDGKTVSFPFREETGLVRKEQEAIRRSKINVKSDNRDFLLVLQQFVNEEI
jgi:hypothetical protein